MPRDAAFAPSGWQVWRVADADDESARTITADRAVEMRETKGDAALLAGGHGAGRRWHGRYLQAAREVDEASLFKEALRLAGREVTRRLSRETREYAEHAVKKARGHGRRFSISLWTEFDFSSASRRTRSILESFCICSACGPSRNPTNRRGRWTGCLPDVRGSPVGNGGLRSHSRKAD